MMHVFAMLSDSLVMHVFAMLVFVMLVFMMFVQYLRVHVFAMLVFPCDACICVSASTDGCLAPPMSRLV